FWRTMKADPETILTCPAGEGGWASDGVAARISARTPPDIRRANMEPPEIEDAFLVQTQRQTWRHTHESGTAFSPVSGDFPEKPLPSADSARVVPDCVFDLEESVYYSAHG